MTFRNPIKSKASWHIFLSLLLALALSGCKITESYMSMPESELTAEQIEMARQERIGWFKEARYGLFIHWGLYAIPGGTWKDTVRKRGYSEWIMFSEKIPREEYAQLAKQFNPQQFDADAWAEVAKRAGMKYVVITAKHHDGFAMFDSKVTDYDILDATPFKRDIIKELEAACHRAGLQFGVYYSVDRDWYRPTGMGSKRYHKQTNTWDFPNSTDEDFDRYFEEIAYPQVKELVTQYDIDLLWFDAIEMKSPEQIERLANMIRKHSPETLINSRIWSPSFPKVVPPPHCDYISSGDNQILANSIDFEWENPGSMNTSYGYNPNDHNWVEPGEIVARLADIVSKGGNYLLNVGPTPKGTFEQTAIDRLLEAGKWMEVNEEAIRNASPWQQYSEGDNIYYTAKGDDVYVICTEWPADTLLLKAFDSESAPDLSVHSVKLLGSKEKIDWTHTADGLQLSVPQKAPNPLGLVYRIQTK